MMKFCPDCGTQLQEKFHEREQKLLPYCECCGRFKYPTYNTAVSMVVTDEREEKILLIKQYGRQTCVLVAGYVNRGEAAEHAVAREVMEELSLEVTSVRFNESRFYERTNTLMLNFSCKVKDMEARPNEEIDSWYVLTREEAKEMISPGSLAEQFLLHWMEKNPIET